MFSGTLQLRTLMDSKAQFLKVYANLPQATREETIAVIRGEPYSWKAAKLEVEQDTLIGRDILEFLSNLKILT